MKRAVAGILVALVCALPQTSTAQQDQTLADIRQELTVLSVEMQRLRLELSTTGGAQTQLGGQTGLDRVNAIEAELSRLTAKVEQLEFRINRVVMEGSNQIGDLQFRLCELEEDCDFATLPDPLTLGGDDAAAVAPPVAQVPVDDGVQLADNERADFERAQEALDDGSFRAAADQFAAFNATYPGSPLAVAAELGRGQALEALGDVREGARAYLSAFTLDQTGSDAAEALFRLGAALGRLGQTNEACVTLAEVGVRFPAAASVAEAQAAMANIGCS